MLRSDDSTAKQVPCSVCSVVKKKQDLDDELQTADFSSNWRKMEAAAPRLS